MITNGYASDAIEEITTENLHAKWSQEDAMRGKGRGRTQAEQVAIDARGQVWKLEREIKRARAIAKTAEGLANLIRLYPDSVNANTTVAELLAMGTKGE